MQRVQRAPCSAFNGPEKLDLTHASTPRPDFAHVLSLKGQFLYASPFVRNVLGYEAEELQGKFIGDFCHPSDIVSVMRELKEATQAAPYGQTVKTVNYLCRVERKVGGYLWLECTGRLHVEPGKGRKVVVLTGRERVLPRLEWSAIGASGGLGPLNQDEGWGMLSNEGLILYASNELQEILGARSASQLLGDSLFEHIPAPLGPPPRATTMSPSQLQPSADDAAHAKIKEALATTSRGLPKNGGITVRHSILLPSVAGHSSSGDGGRHSSAASSRQASGGGGGGGTGGSSGGRPLMVLHEVATTFYAVHLDAPWPDPRSIDRSASSNDGSATPETYCGGGSGSRASPVGSPETDSFPLEERQGPSQRRSKPPPIVFQVKVVRPPPTTRGGSASPASAVMTPVGKPPLAEPTTDVFAEISLQRESSWVYELQQLKRSNGRLRKELAAIRASRLQQQRVESGGKRKRSSDSKPAGNGVPSAYGGDAQLGLGLQQQQQQGFPSASAQQQPAPTVADMLLQKQQQQQRAAFAARSSSSVSPHSHAAAASSAAEGGPWVSPPSYAYRPPSLPLPASAAASTSTAPAASAVDPRRAAYQASLYRAQSVQLATAGQSQPQPPPPPQASGRDEAAYNYPTLAAEGGSMTTAASAAPSRHL